MFYNIRGSLKSKKHKNLNYPIPWSIFGESSSQKSDKIFDCDLVTSIVDLHVIPVNVYIFVLEQLLIINFET